MMGSPPQGSNVGSQGRLAAALSCFGLMADSYDFGIVNLVRPVLEAQFGAMTPGQDAMLTGSALSGAFVGMILFGAAADYMGRRCLFIMTVTLVGVASLGSALAEPFEPLGLSVFSVLSIWRFLMGLGIGGEYPLAAAITVENTDAANSARNLAVIFSGLCFGTILAPALVIFLAGPLNVSGPHLWRYAFGFGALLALVVAFLRFLVLKETQAWQAASSPRARALAPAQPEAAMDFRERSREKLAGLMAMKWSLAGTVGAWLIYDIVTYGVGLYSTTIFPAEPGIASAKIVFAINAMTLPGFAGAVLLAPHMYMKKLQLWGLLVMAALFAMLTVLFERVNRSGFGYLSLFALMRAFDCMGPGCGTFVIPGQIFPTRMRATGHGISAAAGKLGAVIGTAIFPFLNSHAGLQAVMAFMALTSAFGAFWTQIFTPYYDEKVLEDIASLDSTTSLIQQASVAESALFAGHGTKSTIKKEQDYGAMTQASMFLTAASAKTS